MKICLIFADSDAMPHCISRGTKVAYRAKHTFLHPKGIRLEFCILIV